MQTVSPIASRCARGGHDALRSGRRLHRARLAFRGDLGKRTGGRDDRDRHLDAHLRDPSSTSASASAKRVCVINAGQVSGLASDVTDLLKEKGYTMAQPGNYTAGGFSENTIFYDEDSDKAQADQLADALGGTVSVEERPSSFTRCRGGLPVIVVTAVSGS